MTRSRIGAATVALLALATGAAADRPDSLVPVTRARALMGTLCTIRVEAAGCDEAGAASLAARALDEIARLDPLLSSWIPDSELRRLNARAAQAPAPCSPELFEAIERGVELARATGGAFDPSIEPLLQAWDVRGRGRIPPAAEREAARALVDYRNVTCDERDRSVRFARAGTALDLGGIGKGFALDRAAAALATGPGGASARRVLLNFGGEILARSDGAPWNIDLAHPADRLRPVARLAVANAAVSTSGQGERSVRVGGRRIGHILDPRRGDPVASAASVTVVAADATSADALSTALLVMGREEAARFARAHPEIGVVWLEPSGKRVVGWRWNQDAQSTPEGAVRWMD